MIGRWKPQSDCRGLYRADFDGLAQGWHGVFPRHERVREIALGIEVRDGLGGGAAMQLLRIVDLVLAGIAAGVEVADVLDVLANGAGHVARQSCVRQIS